MKWKIITVSAGIVSIVMVAWGQTITAESAPFTFPTEVGVKISGSTLHTERYFRYSGPAARAGTVAFTWSFPAQLRNQKGAITVYSLLGRVVKIFHVSANVGTVAWNRSNESISGVYIARIVCGSDRQSLKLLLYR